MPDPPRRHAPRGRRRPPPHRRAPAPTPPHRSRVDGHRRHRNVPMIESTSDVSRPGLVDARMRDRPRSSTPRVGRACGKARRGSPAATAAAPRRRAHPSARPIAAPRPEDARLRRPSRRPRGDLRRACGARRRATARGSPTDDDDRRGDAALDRRLDRYVDRERALLGERPPLLADRMPHHAVELGATDAAHPLAHEPLESHPPRVVGCQPLPRGGASIVKPRGSGSAHANNSSRRLICRLRSLARDDAGAPRRGPAARRVRRLRTARRARAIPCGARPRTTASRCRPPPGTIRP